MRSFKWIHTSLVFLSLLLQIQLTIATDYYLSPTGSDSNDGTSPSTAWKTLQKVNSMAIQAGDKIRLEGGETFSGRLSFSPSQCGTQALPIVIESYGNGRAIILADGEYGIFVDDCAGYEVHDLHIKADPSISNEGDGILFRRSVSTTSRNDYILIEDVEVEGFKWGGITIDSNEDNSTTEYGYQNVTIRRVIAHDNLDHGIEVRGKILTGTEYAHQHILVTECLTYDNFGIPDKDWNHTGSGIVIGNTEYATIEYSEAHNNGKQNTYPTGGPVGIWLWDSKESVIQHCESHHNQTGNNRDGGGFDLDGGCVSCVIQYCYSHDNEGPGFLLAEFNGAREMKNNVIRFNISENDAQLNNYGVIHLWRQGNSKFNGLDVYHNTIFLSKTGNRSPRIFYSVSNQIYNVRVINNIFVCLDNLKFVEKRLDAGQDIKFYNNVYDTGDDNFLLEDGNTIYNSLQAWQAAAGQERLGGTSVGLQTSSSLNNPGMGITVGNPAFLDTLNSYKLSNTSPILNQGVDLQSFFSINPGSRDYFNQPYSSGGQTSPGSDIGNNNPSGFPIVDLGLKVNRQEEIVTIESNIPAHFQQEEMRVEWSLKDTAEQFQIAGKLPLTGSIRTFHHHNPIQSASYYRITWTDVSGEFFYTEPVKVEGALGLSRRLQWMLDSQTLRLKLPYGPTENGKIWITNSKGAILLKEDIRLKKEEFTRVSLPANMSKGVYHVIFVSNQGLKRMTFSLIY
ncbi:MAG: right-handed parallel beta-helix repeat-containing protein [Bacteroidota bacterium]